MPIPDKRPYTKLGRHEVECSDCHFLFTCPCDGWRRHDERKDFGWQDVCDFCETKAQDRWRAWLATNPETRQYESIGDTAERRKRDDS